MILKQKLSEEPGTIVALSTPAGVGGIGILRLSGASSLAIARQLFTPLKGHPWQPTPRQLTLGWAHNEQGQPLDQVLAVYFPAPHSYTTEDVVELHAHGAPAVLRQLEELCLGLGARLAQPGEFTLRAFLGGRMDLSQAEAVGQLIGARSQQEGRLAIANLRGGLSRRLSPLRKTLLAITAQVEAWLDFPEEQDEVDMGCFRQNLRVNLLQPLNALLEERERGRVFREGARILLCGRPNAGKSSLFNALLGRDKALVSPHPGTTRDGLQDEVLLGGVVCCLQDSAGLGQEAAEAGAAGRELARLGQEATRQALGQADLLLVLLDSSQPLADEDWYVLDETSQYPRLLLATKTDLPFAWPLQQFENILEISVRQGSLQALSKAIVDKLLQSGGEPQSGQVVVSARQSLLLRQMGQAFSQVETLSSQPEPAWELIAWELQQALHYLGALDGQGAMDEVLEEIFSTFCLGK